MIAGVVLFEDAGWRKLRPLTDTLPTAALAFGGSSLGERLVHAAQASLVATVARDDVLAAWNARPGAAAPAAPVTGDLLALNAAAQPGAWLAPILAAADGTRAAWFAGARLVAARLPHAELPPLSGSGEEFAARIAALALPRQESRATLLEYPWQMIEWNSDALADDLARPTGVAGEVHPNAVLLSPGHVSIGAGARVDPLVVLDARDGPIAIGPRAVVLSHTRVVGPCSIGAGTLLLGGVVSSSSIGPECRLAGEIEASIWQGYANKRHHGFVGHSVVGEWANLGALTTTSDLKNNYGAVRVWVDGAEVDSGNPKVGALIGAHVKTGIGTLLPTGASVGAGANLFGGGRFAPKRVASFAWWDGERTIDHELDKFLATARIAMSRRGRELGAAEERMLRGVFARTTTERAAVASATRAG